MSGDCCLFMIETRRRKIVSIIIPVALLLTSFVFFNPIVPRAVALMGHSNILIVGNSGFTPANGVVSGTGTASNRYGIFGWDISSSATNICLKVEDTPAYIRMENHNVSCRKD